VKKIGKFFVYLLFFIFALILFMPKSSLYYFAETELKEFGVLISNETLVESFSTLKVKNLDVSVKGIESVDIVSADFTLLGVYNNISFQNIKLSSIVEAYLPSKIEDMNIVYSLLHPLSIRAKAIGDFGEVNANFDLLELKLKADLKPSKLMLRRYRSSLHFFKKSKEGEYIYAKSIQ